MANESKVSNFFLQATSVVTVAAAVASISECASWFTPPTRGAGATVIRRSMAEAAGQPHVHFDAEGEQQASFTSAYAASGQQVLGDCGVWYEKSKVGGQRHLIAYRNRSHAQAHRKALQRIITGGPSPLSDVPYGRTRATCMPTSPDAVPVGLTIVKWQHRTQA